MCKITIRTNTFNREHLLPRAVNSVLAQTFTDFQYLIVNNGSTDGTQALIDQYKKKDSRIHSVAFPFNSKDTAVELERNKLLEHYYTTPYYMSIDDDDFMEPNTVETLYNLITQYDADIAQVGSRFVYPDGTMKDKFVFNGIYVYNRIEAMVEMLKREKFNQASGGKLFHIDINLKDVEVLKTKQSRDIHHAYRRMNKIRRMVVTGEPLFYFYRHDKNQSGLETAQQITPQKMRQHLEANAIRTEWLTENMPEIKDFVFYCELSFMISLYERIHRLDVQSCFDIALEMKETLIRHSAFLKECGFLKEHEIQILEIMGL